MLLLTVCKTWNGFSKQTKNMSTLKDFMKAIKRSSAHDGSTMSPCSFFKCTSLEVSFNDCNYAID